MRAGAQVLAALATPAACAPPTVGAADAGRDFEAFRDRCRAALPARDATAIADLTRLPFLYEGRCLDRAGFVQAAPALFDARLSACLAQARPQAEGADRLLYCAPCTFHLRTDAGGRWRLAEFAAGGEDMP
jgi:hypothetical protein